MPRPRLRMGSPNRWPRNVPRTPPPARHHGWWRSLVPLVTVLAGLLFATSAVASNGHDLRGAQTGLADLIRSRTHTVAVQAHAVDQSRSHLEALGRRQLQRDPQLAADISRSDALTGPAGDSAVHGPGLSVELSDAPAGRIPQGYGVDDVVVHQQDVQAVVNALWSGGAEAMMIQDQRVISTSAVRCVGNTLILQGRVYSPPYRVTAIGDATTMSQALNADPGVSAFRDYVQRVGLGYRSIPQPDIRMPGYTGSLELRSARRAP